MATKTRIALTILAVLALAGVSPASGALTAPTSLAVADLDASDEVVDPQFTWAAVSGAKGYEVEINYSNDWAAGSKVCCSSINYSTKITTYGTAYSPPVVLPNNTYNWRVRAIDASNNAGPWAAGASFAKTFANVPAITPPSVQNLRLTDRNLDVIMPGSTTDTPIVLWDPVPGAASYQVVTTPFTSGACNWSASTVVRFEDETTTTGWTPLGWTRDSGADPVNIGTPPESDGVTHLDVGQDYCVRVRPVDKASVGTGGPVIYGDWTYLPDNNVASFTWSGYQPDDVCSPCSMMAGDYVRPVNTATVGSTPVFTWDPIPGAKSWFVVVSRDAAFTTIVDYAYTRVPAYAPRRGTLTKGYADETTDYYWAVLPATTIGGSGVSADAASSEPPRFKKDSTKPAIIGPTGGVLVTGAATTFHWNPVLYARRYRIQVADDPTFVNVIQELSTNPAGAVTDSSAYTSNTAYPGGRTLYWRVQAEAEDGSNFVGLAWSLPASFQKPVTSGSGGGSVQKFKLSATGFPVKNRLRTITITAKNFTSLAPVSGAAVRVSGAGVPLKTKYTGSTGKVSFSVKATMYPGTVTFKVTKAGYTTAYVTRKVRLP